MSIFNSEKDYTRFVKLLYLANSNNSIQYSDLNEDKIWSFDRGEALVDIGAYCLMPNHFHLLIKSKNETDTSLFLQRILISHSKYFNKKNDRSGSLFQGKSKSEHLNTDNYLKYIFAYIHLNPVKLINKNWKENKNINIKKTLNYLKNYNHSSFLDYLEIEREENKILNKKAFPEYFKNKKEVLKEITDWFNSSSPLPISDIGKGDSPKL